MQFRTEIDIEPSPWKISHGEPIVMLGSCFTDEVGQRLEMDGFNVVHNPLGPLFNPLSICRCIDRIIAREPYTDEDLTDGPRGFHCLDFAMRFSGENANIILNELNAVSFDILSRLNGATVILTLGTAYVYERRDNGMIVGNCHKFPADFFNRRLTDTKELVRVMATTFMLMQRAGVKHVLLTVSPIRHTADGLHGNNVSKSTLHLAVEELCNKYPDFVNYFPAYEIVIDDLRDYRFYASDLKHPSEMAVDYIYEKFAETFFSSITMQQASACRKLYKLNNHRPIL